MTKNTQNTSLTEIQTFYEPLIAEAKASGNLEKLSQIFNHYGQALFGINQISGGTRQLDDAIRTAQTIGNRQLEAAHLGIKGAMLVSIEDMDEGFLCFEEALKIAREIEDVGLTCDALNSMGMVQLETGDPATALNQFNEALDLAKEHEDQMRRMNALSGLGNTYLTIAAQEKAVQFFGEALKIAESLGIEDAQAGFLTNLATIEKNAKNMQRAAELFEKSRKMAHEKGNALGERNALRHLIELYSEDPAKSDLVLVYLDRAISLSKQLGDYESEASYEDAKILVYLHTNQAQKAIQIIDEALVDDRLSRIPNREMQLLVNRGNALFDMDELDEAFQTYQRALKSAGRRQNWRVEARALGRLGAVEAERGQLESALYYAERSLKRAEEIEDKHLIGEQNIMLAMAHRDLGNTTEAVAVCEKAVETYKGEGPNPFAEKAALLLEELKGN